MKAELCGLNGASPSTVVERHSPPPPLRRRGICKTPTESVGTIHNVGLELCSSSEFYKISSGPLPPICVCVFEMFILRERKRIPFMSVPVSSTKRTVVRASDIVSLRQLGTCSSLDRNLFLKEHILSSFLLKDKE